MKRSQEFDENVHVYGNSPAGIEEAILQLRVAMREVVLYSKYKEWCTDSCLRRFLVSKDMHIPKAKEMLISTLEWRERRKPHEINPENPCVENEGITGKVYVPGFDKWGCPVVILDNSVENTTNPSKQLEFLAFKLELAVSEMSNSPNKGVEKFVVFIHMENYNIFNQPSLEVTIETIKVVSMCFPECLGHVIIYRPPGCFKVFFTLIAPFIDERTMEKIVVIIGDVSTDSKNDLKMRRLVGSNWKVLCGAEQPVLKLNSSPGYNHEEYWPLLVRRSKYTQRTKLSNQLVGCELPIHDDLFVDAPRYKVDKEVSSPTPQIIKTDQKLSHQNIPHNTTAENLPTTKIEEGAVVVPRKCSSLYAPSKQMSIISYLISRAVCC